MPMILIHLIDRKQLLTGLKSKLPVVVVDALTFRIPPADRGEREHKVQLDDQERPAACSCTCAKGLNGEPCWAMARALVVRQLFGENHVYVSRGAESSWRALLEAASAVERTASARVIGDDLALTWGGHPETESIYVVP